MKVGDQLGNFVIDGELGSGSFGAVYSAHNRATPSIRRAFKILRQESGDNRELADLFLREAAILQRIQSPHVCRIHDVGYTEDLRPYLSMELLEGETLAALLKRGPLPPETALEFIRQMCDGLEAVHGHDVVHRDLKPANVFVTRAGSGAHLKIFDFNIAKPLTSLTDLGISASLTAGDDSRAAGPGTTPYMSPEQIVMPGSVDQASDVWALGVILFEMVAGHTPFLGADRDAIQRAIINQQRAKLPTTHPTVAAVIEGCLAPRDRRFTSVTEVRAAATILASGSGTGTGISPSPPAGHLLGWSISAREWLIDHWIFTALASFGFGLLLLLGSFAAHPDLNEFKAGSKPIGYIRSFNWSLVHVFATPALIAMTGTLLGQVTRIAAGMGPIASRSWDRCSRRILITWFWLTLVLAVGYTVVEWRFVLSGSCDEGTLLGWPNKLCDEGHGQLGTLAFMSLAMLAQMLVLSVGWLWFAVILLVCDVFFVRTAKLESERAAEISEVFRHALRGWTTLFISLYLARLWSFHLQIPSTGGVWATLVEGLPGSLLEIKSHSQPDMGGIIASIVIAAMACAPFILLQVRAVSAKLVPWPRGLVGLGVVGVLAMIFPRLGAFVIALALGIAGVRATRSAH